MNQEERPDTSSDNGSRDRPLFGQVAIVTGASGAIGQAIVRELAVQGADILIHYWSNRNAAIELAKDCHLLGIRTEVVQADLSDPEQARGLVTAATALGSPKVLVNNAGVSHTALLTDTTLDTWEHLLRINLTAPYLCIQAVLPHMLRHGYGRIVNIASIWGVVGGATEVAYSASKGGLVALGKALAKELGPSGITVNTVAPGAIDTPMLSTITPSDQTQLARSVPVGRLGQPADVAAAVTYLVSPSAGYTTGQVLSPNGGWYT